MNVIDIFTPVGDGQLFAEQAAAKHGLDVLRRDGDPARTNPDLRKTSGRAQTIPPFWTWFIENPRSCAA